MTAITAEPGYEETQRRRCVFSVWLLSWGDSRR